MRIIVAGSLLAACAVSVPVATAQTADRYFGQLETPCGAEKNAAGAVLATSKARCDGFKGLVTALIKACQAIDRPCEQGTKLLNALFGGNHTPALPNFIVYFDQSQGEGKFRQQPPRLMWQGENTPHLYGVTDVFVLVLSEHKACTDAIVHAELKTEPNPFKLIFDLLGAKVEQPAPKPPAAANVRVRWFPLNADAAQPSEQFWLGFARVTVEQNTVNRVTLPLKQPQEPREQQKVERNTVDRKTTEKITFERTVPDPDDECTKSSVTYTGDTRGVNGFFSNSPRIRVGFSLALGITADVHETAIAKGDSDEAFNGYALVKLYARRPRLNADLDERTYRMSIGAFVGTSVKNVFDEIVAGFSFGHLFGTVGVVVGGNYVAAAEGIDRGRRWKPFVGVDYTF